MTAPRVSVVIPTYRRAGFLREAVDSALAQTVQDAEVIVVEDGSRDAEEVLRPLGARVRYAWQPNQGAAAARNLGAELAAGEWLAFLDDDDLWLPDKLARQLAHVEGAPEIGLVHTAYFHQTDGGRRLAPRFSRRGPIPTGWVTDALFADNFILTSSTLVRRRAFAAVGGFDTRYVRAQDYDLWLRLSCEHRFGFVADPLAVYRIHPGTLTERIDAPLTRADVLGRFLDTHPGVRARLGRDRVRRRFAEVHLDYARRFFWADTLPAAQRHFLAAWAWNPRNVRALVYAGVCRGGLRFVTRLRSARRLVAPGSADAGRPR